jgi:hypothetical protein
MESVQYQAQPMAQPQVQPQVGQPLTIKDYISIIGKRKKIILVLAVVFMIIVLVFLTLAKGGNEVNSLISLVGEKGEIGPIVEQKVILEGSDVIEPVIAKNFQEAISLDDFKSSHMTVELVRERVDRTKEQLVSFLSLTTKADTKEQAKKINDDLVKQFFEIIEPRYGAQKAIKEKISVFEEEEQALKEYITLIEQVIFESSQEIENANELVTKFKIQIDAYVNRFESENIKGKTLDYYPLMHTKVLNDISRFREQVIEAEEATWHSSHRDAAAERFIKQLNAYQDKLTSQNISEMPVENFVLMQFEMEEALNQFQKDVVGNTTQDDFTGEQAMNQLLDKRKALSDVKIQKVQFEQDLLLEKNAYSVLSSPSLANSLTSSSNAVIKVSKDYEDVYAALEAQELLTSSEIMEPVIVKYSDMSFETFIARNLNIDKVKVVTNQGNNQILPFITIDLAGPTSEESKQMLQEVLDNFFNYINEHNNYADKVKLVEEKIELKQDEINNIKIDVNLFETDIYGQNLMKLREISLLKTKLLLSDYKKRLSDISTEKIDLQDQLRKQGTFNLISAPLTIQGPGEKFAPNKTNFIQIGITAVVGFFIAIFLVIAYETKFPEYQARYAQFVQAQNLPVQQGSVQPVQPVQQPIQPIQQMPQPVQQPAVQKQPLISKLFAKAPPVQQIAQPVAQAPAPQPVVERKPFFQNLFANKTKDVYYVTKNSFDQTVRNQDPGLEELNQLKTTKLDDTVKDEFEVMSKIKKNLKAI